MAVIINLREAKSTFLQLVQRAAAGETILIGPNGRALARLVSADSPVQSVRRIGLLKGKLKVPADFDTRLTDDVLDAFEGKQ